MNNAIFGIDCRNKPPVISHRLAKFLNHQNFRPDALEERKVLVSNPSFNHAAALFKESEGHYLFKDSNGGLISICYKIYIIIILYGKLVTKKFRKYHLSPSGLHAGGWLVY